MKNKTVVILVAAMAQLHGMAIAQNLNVNGAVTATGNVVSQGGNIVSQSGNVTAQNNLIAVTGYVKAQTYFWTPGYLSVNGSGSFGTTLSIGATLRSGSGAANGSYSTALGADTANGSYSAVIAGGVTGSGASNSTAISGGSTSNNAQYSVALSGGTTKGNYSVSMGPDAVAPSYACVVLGRNNVTTKDNDGVTAFTTGSWVDTEPLFVIGNGTGNAADPANVKNRNAFTVYKDGTVTMSKAQGDILMGVYGN